MASKDENKALWVRSCGVTRGLRPPNTVQNSRKETEEPDICTISNLSADAEEWYPSNHIRTERSKIQDRLLVHKHSHENDSKQKQIEFEINMPQTTYSDNPDILRLKQIINTLTNDPGQFEHLLDIFMDTLCPYYEEILVLSDAARLIVDTAINNQNFRYTGARLCYHIEQYCPEFRAEVHLSCKKRLEQDHNVQNVVLFVAELYTQLHHMNIYGPLLLDSFKRLLSIGGNENVKCICQALKLTGHSLEEYDKNAMDGIFEQLTALRPTVSGSALLLLDTVISLRGSQWGYNNSSEQSQCSNSDQEPFLYNAPPVFFNTDGHTFTSEESEFLAANLHSNDEYLTDGSDPDELCDPEPEMDEEIQAAFREFVKLSKR